MSDDLTEKQREILQVIRENPEMTKDEIAEAADTSKSYVTRVQNNYDVSDLEQKDEGSESTVEEDNTDSGAEDEEIESDSDEDAGQEEEVETDDDDAGSDTEYEFDQSDVTAKGGIGGILLALLLFGGVWFYYQTQIMGMEIPLLLLA